MNGERQWVTEAMSKNQTVIPVMRYMRTHPGTIIHYTDIAKDLNIDDKRVNACLGSVVRDKPNYGVRREGSGQYVYRPHLETEEAARNNAASAPTFGQMYEHVGTSKDGVPIVRDETGTLWRLSERV
jgi:hypothetical protein